MTRADGTNDLRKGQQLVNWIYLKHNRNMSDKDMVSHIFNMNDFDFDFALTKWGSMDIRDILDKDKGLN